MMPDMPAGPTSTPGGGVGGGPIEGTLTVFVISEDSPVAAATVYVVTSTRTLQATTAADGRADFTDPALLGSVTWLWLPAYPQEP